MSRLTNGPRRWSEGRRVVISQRCAGAIIPGSDQLPSRRFTVGAPWSSTGNDVEALRNVLEESHVVAIDLAEIELVDRDAVIFLGLGESSGIELTHCPAFIREWITRERDRT